MSQPYDQPAVSAEVQARLAVLEYVTAHRLKLWHRLLRELWHWLRERRVSECGRLRQGPEATRKATAAAAC